MRNEKPCERSDGAVQHVHCGRVADNPAGDRAAQGCLWVTLAPCGEGEEHWDECCVQERSIFSPVSERRG